VNKRGVHAAHHAIIYSGERPIAFRGEKEKGLQMRSIKVSLDSPRHKLDDASRLNYAKTYTVEYNVKVVSVQLTFHFFNLPPTLSTFFLRGSKIFNGTFYSQTHISVLLEVLISWTI